MDAIISPRKRENLSLHRKRQTASILDKYLAASEYSQSQSQSIRGISPRFINRKASEASQSSSTSRRPATRLPMPSRSPSPSLHVVRGVSSSSSQEASNLQGASFSSSSSKPSVTKSPGLKECRGRHSGRSRDQVPRFSFNFYSNFQPFSC